MGLKLYPLFINNIIHLEQYLRNLVVHPGFYLWCLVFDFFFSQDPSLFLDGGLKKDTSLKSSLQIWKKNWKISNSNDNNNINNNNNNNNYNNN